MNYKNTVITDSGSVYSMFFIARSFNIDPSNVAIALGIHEWLKTDAAKYIPAPITLTSSSNMLNELIQIYKQKQKLLILVNTNIILFYYIGFLEWT